MMNEGEDIKLLSREEFLYYDNLLKVITTQWRYAHKL